MRRLVRSCVVVPLMGLLFLGSVTTANATTGVGTQNPHFTVRVSALSNGVDPNRATIGDTVTLAGSVRNNTSQTRRPTVTIVIDGPAGRLLDESDVLTLRPRQTLSDSYTYVVDSSFAPGEYRLTVSATGVAGTSSATATLVVH